MQGIKVIMKIVQTQSITHIIMSYDKIIGEFVIEDMAPTRDPSQYGNEKKISAQHYLIKMLHRILTAVDRNSQKEAMVVILNMVDWSQAFFQIAG